VSEPASHHEPDYQANYYDGYQAHSASAEVAATVSVKPTTAEQQYQQYDYKQHANRSLVILVR
jgi:hypothetical protein